MGIFSFGKDQLYAIDMATSWLKSGYQKPVFVIGGYAGTGKSTVLSQVLANMGIPMYKVAFATYTGKAAVVLRQKGMNAFTLHKLIYNVSVGTSGKPFFRKKPRLPGNIELICIDELGMVPNEIMVDLISYGIPILTLGDPFQLPPIYGENDYIVKPDVFLREVYRNSGDVLNVATDIRDGINIFAKTYGSDVTIVPKGKFGSENLLKFDQILCSKNSTRSTLNVECRRLLKRNSPLPCEFEKIICLRNNFKDVIPMDTVDFYMVNGLMGSATSDAMEIGEDVLYYRFKPDYLPFDIPIYSSRKKYLENYEDFGVQAEDAPQAEVIEFYNDKVVNLFDYGYAITTHKSQGSEWGDVVVYDDCFYNDDVSYRRWMYTSVTRAKKTVTIIRT